MPTSTTRSVERALNLLTAVCEEPGINLTSAAEKTDLSPSSALRLLHTLEEMEFIHRDRSGRFSVGSKMLRLGFKSLEENTLRNQCRPAMTELAEATGESVYLSIKQGNLGLYLGLVRGSHAIQHRSWEGQTVPLTSTAIGAVLSEKMGTEKYVEVTSGVEKDITSIAAPLIIRGKTVAALSMLVPTYRMSPERTEELGNLLARKVRELNTQFGTTQPRQ